MIISLIFLFYITSKLITMKELKSRDPNFHGFLIKDITGGS